MIRVVLDTNIIVSTTLQPLGMPAQIFLLAAGRVILMCGAEEIEGVLRTVRDKAHWVKPSLEVKICSECSSRRGATGTDLKTIKSVMNLQNGVAVFGLESQYLK